MPFPLDNASLAVLISVFTGIVLPIARWWRERDQAADQQGVERAKARDASVLSAAEQWRDIAERLESKLVASDNRIEALEREMETMRLKFARMYDAFEYLAKEVETTHAQAVAIARAKAAGRWPPQSE